MPQVTMDELRQIAEYMGHRDLNVVPTGTGVYWIATCSCGYRSTRRSSVKLATQAAVHHFEVLGREWAASGVSLRSLHLADEAAS